MALAASIGSPERLSCALVGDTVNIASRLQGLTKDLSTTIVVSSITRERLSHFQACSFDRAVEFV